LLWIVVMLLSLFILQLAVIIAAEYRRPYKALTWLTLSFLVPVVGLLAYFLIAKEYVGFRPVSGNRFERLDRIQEDIMKRSMGRMAANSEKENEWLRQAKLFRGMIGFPVTACNKTTVFSKGDQAFEAMLDAIAAARHHIHILFYIVRSDRLGIRFEQLLIRKAREGVKVRFIYDGVGSRHLDKSFLKRLKSGGVETGCFFPILSALFGRRLNYRNHRKIVVVDGNIGFFGGLNIGDEYVGRSRHIGYWRDTHFAIAGDAVLWLQYTFLADWLRVKGQIPEDEDYFPDQPDEGKEFVQIVRSGPKESLHELIFSLIVSAKERLYVESPYFIPDPAVMLALKTAAAKGVDVAVVLPGKPDKKLVYIATMSYVREMLPSGIRFYRYRKGFIHSKVIISDNVGFSGSANLDMRSFWGQFEIDAVFWDGNVVGRLEQDFFRDLEGCEAVKPADFEGWNWKQRAYEVWARLLSPLF
jgi:cardiolipin synthase